MENQLNKKLASYGALSSAFLLSAAPEAEAQIVYVDVEPDFVATVSASVSFSTTSYSSKVIGFNPANTSNPLQIISNGSGPLGASNAFPAQGFTFNMSASAYAISFGISSYSFARVRLAMQPQSNLFGSGLTPNLNFGDPISEPGFSSPGSTLAMGRDSFSTFTSSFSDAQAAQPASSSGNFITSNFASVGSTVMGYVGFRFDNGGTDNFGWMRIQVDATASVDGQPIPNAKEERNNVNTRAADASITLTVMDYAYNSAGDPINAGQTEAAAIPTMGQWGLIILNLFLVIIGVKFVQEKLRQPAINSIAEK